MQGEDTTPMTDTETDVHEPLVDFVALRRRVGATMMPLAGLCLLGAVVDGAIRGLTFELMGRWFGMFVLLAVLVAAVATALHALSGASRAEQRGERLSSPDVGLTPRKIEGRTFVSAYEHAVTPPAAPDEDSADADTTDDTAGDHGPR
ncbi:hypothetical protein DVS28_a2785 [Euzebya pacifica]|uniref:Uncharacterized protein n=2 Tax=Euzebya pacifica TaxID=1608957 RepID=A0A346XZ17_9ACTN|nr:hypothetical protein DVS28_a2785 [Euzebya pacifica]